MKVVIDGELTDFNTYSNAERTHRQKAARIKKKETYRVMASFLPYRLEEPKLPINLKIKWVCKNRMKDKDNISFAKKFIFDGMQQAGYIKNDGWGEIGSWTEEFLIDKNRPRVEIEIEERKD